ncbi:hypothetical protein [Gemmatimonas sp.]|jgi:hypothetical protein|uniref:hypothetical protein n=1 Tax=Gemmatimonas sp. TaxID=1962908 RepID=UPI0037C0C6C3
MSQSPRPKSLALMFILGALLTGGAVGFVAARAASQPVVMATDDRAMRAALARELELTPQQTASVDSAWDWRRARSREIMTVVRPALDSVRDSARVLMMTTLSESQKERFRALIERNQRIADSTAKARANTR